MEVIVNKRIKATRITANSAIVTVEKTKIVHFVRLDGDFQLYSIIVPKIVHTVN